MRWGGGGVGLRADVVAAGQGPGPTQAAALTFAHPTPDAELLAVGQGVLETVLAHDAAPAHLFRFARRRPPLWEEQIGIDAHAVGLNLPAALLATVER